MRQCGRNEKGTLGLIFNKAQNKFDSRRLRAMLALRAPCGRPISRWTKDEKRFLKEGAFRGWELVQATARVCAMNLLLHSIGSEKSVPVKVADALAADPGERFDVVLANPPFGKKSSTMIVGEDGKTSAEKDIVERDDFWATTSNKQLNFGSGRRCAPLRSLRSRKPSPQLRCVQHIRRC